MNAFDAIYDENIEALREYLELGDINVQNERGMSLLHAAILFGNNEIFDLLLENYINVNLKDKHGDTPAHFCIINNRMGFLKMLIRHNADLTIKNDEGHTPLYKACLLGRENMISLLLESISFNLYEEDIKEETIFMALVRSRNLDLLHKVILDEDILDKKNFKGETALHIASLAGDKKIIEYLLSYKAFVNAKTNQGETPLFYAIKGRNREVVDLLLAHGAMIDCKNKNGEICLDLVEADLMQSFIEEREIKYHHDEYRHLFPLHYAIILEDYISVKKYATIRNIDRVDTYGYKPKELAKRINNVRIIKLLEEN